MREGDGRSKGCRIIEYSTAEESQEAIVVLTDTKLKGRIICVRKDRKSGGGGGSGRGGYNEASASVCVGNLAFETICQDLKYHMCTAGNVDQVSFFLYN